MTDLIELAVRGALIGAGGAALMDVWAWLARRAFNVQGLDYALLGRWIGHFPRGRFFHDRIADAEPVRGERPLGWLAHYTIGVTFAVLLLAIWGLDWARHDRRSRVRLAARHGARRGRVAIAAARGRPGPQPRHPRRVRDRAVRLRGGARDRLAP
jgi:hypothetical protein